MTLVMCHKSLFKDVRQTVKTQKSLILVTQELYLVIKEVDSTYLYMSSVVKFTSPSDHEDDREKVDFINPELTLSSEMFLGAAVALIDQ
ncbi:hypothetical protein Tco_0606877, partial [Tanacetum coccineum]